MGAQPGAQFSAVTSQLPPETRLVILSDGVFEIRREGRAVWDLDACIAHVAGLSARGESVMDGLLDRARELRGSPQLDDDFSVIEAHFQ
jgi:serine phosphatase RsbU (regulator of sigma subunit)